MMNVCKSLQSVRFSAEPKGIGSILGEDLEAKQKRSGNSSPSLRRTLSADMSSQGWIKKTPLRKICSSYELNCNSDSDEDLNDGEDEQEDYGDIFPMTDGEEEEKSTSAEEKEQNRDLWSLMRLQNKKSSLSSLIPRGQSMELGKKVESLSPFEPCKPYVYPKKESKLSNRSLWMCTEALGCESGSDCSDQSPSDMDDICSSSSSEDEEERNENLEFESENCKFRCNAQEKEVIFGAKSFRSGRSFPPPLSSVSGAAVQMRSIKQDGRLLLQAVKVNSQKYLRAHRHGGRLQLHFINSPPNCSEKSSENQEFKAPKSFESQLPEEQEFKAPKCSESQPQEEQEFKAPKSSVSQPPDELEFKSQKSLLPPSPPQRKPYMFPYISNLRLQAMKPDYKNISISKESCLNLDFNSKEQQQEQSFVKEVRCSSRSSNFSNEFCKASIPAPLNAIKNSLQSRAPSQSLVTSPSLLNYPRSGIGHVGADLAKFAHSLPKLPPLKEDLHPCNERIWSLKWESYCIAIS